MKKNILFSIVMMAGVIPASAQDNRLSIGYKAEATMNVKDHSHKQFDISNAVSISYNLGKGWTIMSEFDFEHSDTGLDAANEDGNLDHETDNKDKAWMEEFWIEKSFCTQFNVRVGKLMVPVGLINAYNDPMDYFTVNCPEHEGSMLPSAWHDRGVSLWGNSGKFHYEAIWVTELDGLAARIENSSIDGLRIGISGYYGKMANDYDKQKNKIAVCSADFTFDRINWILRGNVEYGHFCGNTSMDKKMLSYNIVAGYNIFSQWQKMKDKQKKLFVFGKYENFDSYMPTNEQQKFECSKNDRIIAGFNYMPIQQIAIKAEFSKGIRKNQSDKEPLFSIGIAYQGNIL